MAIRNAALVCSEKDSAGAPLLGGMLPHRHTLYHRQIGARRFLCSLKKTDAVKLRRARPTRETTTMHVKVSLTSRAHEATSHAFSLFNCPCKLRVCARHPLTHHHPALSVIPLLLSTVLQVLSKTVPTMARHAVLVAPKPPRDPLGGDDRDLVPRACPTNSCPSWQVAGGLKREISIVK